MGHASAISNSTMAVAPSASFKNDTSPIPYLFGSLALMLALIGLALLILACSYSKSSSSTSNEEKTTKRMEVDSEPKIVVIMAGDSNPTYLAKPVPSTNHTEEEAD